MAHNHLGYGPFQYKDLYNPDFRAPDGEEDCEQYRDDLVCYCHDTLTVDFVGLMAVNPFSKRNAAKPEEKERYKTEKDPNDCDHSYPPCVGLI